MARIALLWIAIAMIVHFASGQSNWPVNIGTTFNKTVTRSQQGAFQMLFDQNLPAVVTLQLGQGCDAEYTSITVQGYQDGFVPVTPSGAYVMPIAMNGTAIRVSYTSSDPCVFLGSSYYATPNAVNVSGSASAQLDIGQVVFYTVPSTSNEAVQVTVTPSNASCVLDVIWDTAVATYQSYEDRAQLTTQGTYDIILFPFYGSVAAFSVMVQADSFYSKSQCQFTLETKPATVNIVNYANMQTVSLDESDPFNSLTVINATNVVNPIDFIFDSPQALAGVKVRFSDKTLQPIVVAYNGSNNLQYYYTSIGRNKSSTFYLSLITSQPWTGSVNTTMETITPTVLNFNQAVTSTLHLNQWDFYQTEFIAGHPQYMSFSVISIDNCVEQLWAFVNAAAYPDDMDGDSGPSSTQTVGNNTIFRFPTLPPGSTESVHIGVLGSGTCQYNITIYMESFPTFVNGTTTSGKLYPGEYYYYQYAVIDLAYLALTVYTNAIMIVQYSRGQLPIVSDNDGIVITGTTTTFTIDPETSSEPANIYFVVWTANSFSSYNILFEELQPLRISPSQTVTAPFVCQLCASYFAVENVNSDIIAFQYDTTQTNALSFQVQLSFGVGALSGTNVTVENGVLTREMVGGSWDDVYITVGYMSLWQGGSSITLYDNGDNLKWGTFYTVSTQPNSYFFTVVPASANMLQFSFEAFSTANLAIFGSWTAPPTSQTGIRIPLQAADSNHGDVYSYTVPLNLTADTAFYYSISSTDSFVYNGFVQTTASFQSTVYVSTSSGFNTSDSLAAYWNFYNVLSGGGIWDSSTYDVTFTLTSPSPDRFTFVFGDSMIPTATEFTAKAKQNGQNLEIKITNVKGTRLGNLADNLNMTLGVYAGDDASASIVPYSIVATAKAQKSNSPSLGIILAGVFGGLGFVILVAAIIYVIVRQRRRNYAPIH